MPSPAAAPTEAFNGIIVLEFREDDAEVVNSRPIASSRFCRAGNDLAVTLIEDRGLECQPLNSRCSALRVVRLGLTRAACEA